MKDIIGFSVRGFLKIYDPNTGEVFLDKNNAINYENMSEAMALTLANRGYGNIYQMAFGNGGSSVDATGLITYLPPNVTGQNAALYNQTFQKIVDDTLILNTDPLTNKMTVTHTSGKLYSDVVISCLLDYGEPEGQMAFDNGTSMDNAYTFDEMGILANYGMNSDGSVNTRLLTHVIFHPIQKTLNRQLQIDYTIRVQSLTNMLTI
jgi:hypothetical protein